jgi:hypothetical protein
LSPALKRVIIKSPRLTHTGIARRKGGGAHPSAVAAPESPIVYQLKL